MIELTTCVWTAAGLFAGIAHATFVWRTAHAPTAWTPLVGALRLAVVALVFVLSALTGSILAAAAGWAVGFVVMGARLFSRSDTAMCRNTHRQESVPR